jgi:maltose alpha-D-glucosyltransferase/alpha-amylase
MDKLSVIDITEMPVTALDGGERWHKDAIARGVFERDVLPEHLARSRWYPERSAKAIHPTLTSAMPFCDIGDNRPWLVFFETEQRGATQRYLTPVQIEWTRFNREKFNSRSFATVCQGAREGTLLDVATEPTFIALLLRNLRQSSTVDENNARLEFRPTPKFADKPIKTPKYIRAVETEQSNSTALVDNDYVVKIYRKIESGINPEIEMGRFLTEVAGFANTPALLGSVELVEGNKKSAIAVVHAFVANQGDGWAVTSAYLDRFVEEQRLLAASQQSRESEVQVAYLRYMSQTGKRVGEMHLALSGSRDHPNFAPEQTEPAAVQRWIEDIMTRAERVFDILKHRRDATKEADLPLVDQLLVRGAGLQNRLTKLLPPDTNVFHIRHHGDFHLGQMLIVNNDVFIIDFEGEPRRSLAERRRKAPAARDVVGLIRSIDYSTTAAMERALEAEPEGRDRLAAALAEWRERSVTAFLSAYREITANAQLWPADPRAAENLLNFFLLEKAFYEVEYELAYRPEWLRVPLTGIVRILGQANGAS